MSEAELLGVAADLAAGLPAVDLGAAEALGRVDALLARRETRRGV